jgi:hypothetical protein
MDPHGGPAMDPPQGTLRFRSQGSPRKVFPKDPPPGDPPSDPPRGSVPGIPFVPPNPSGGQTQHRSCAILFGVVSRPPSLVPRPQPSGFVLHSFRPRDPPWVDYETHAHPFHTGGELSEGDRATTGYALARTPTLVRGTSRGWPNSRTTYRGICAGFGAVQGCG